MSYALSGVFAIVALVAGLSVTGFLLRSRRDWRYADLTPGLAPPIGTAARAERTPLLGSRDVVPQFAPPSGVTPGEAGLLLRGRPSSADTAATLVDLSVRGYLRIDPRDGDYVLDLTRPPDDTLRPHEHALLYRLFEDSKSVRLSTTADTMAYAVDEVNRALIGSAVRRGWYRSAPSGWFLRKTGAALAASTVLGSLSLFLALTVPIDTIDVGLGLGAVVFLLAPIGVALVLHNGRGQLPAGYAVGRQAAGFRHYLETAEADQIRLEETDDSYRRHLPWAIAFGLTTQWTHFCRQLAEAGTYWVPDPDRPNGPFTAAIEAIRRRYELK